jgi:hypothetical protein
MKKLTNSIVYIALFSAVLLTFASTATAQKRNERDIRDSLRSLNSKLDDFEYNLRNQMQGSSASRDDLADMEDDIRALRDTIYDFQENYNRQRENRDDVNKIAQAARPINDGVRNLQLNRRVEDDWKGVRSQIDRLSANYGVVNKWDGSNSSQYPQYPPMTSTSGTFNVGLSGTYDIDRARSENIDDVVSDTNLGNDQQQDLKSKLEAPEQIAIDIRGQQVTLATTNASPVTFIADGRDKVEKDAQGRTIRLRATLSGNTLTVASLGGETDYTIIFTSVSNGRGMKVSRRITTDYLNQTVFAESVYNKTDSVARLGIPSGGNTTYDPNGGYSDNDQSGNTGGAPTIATTRPGNYVVPNGVVITGRLENEINTKVSQNNDRFRMTVQSPDEFRGATVEGYISGIKSSGKIKGEPKITFNFERITLRNGQTYDFAANLQSVQDSTGKVVKIDNEGTARGDSQTKETVKRGGIGAGAGAILGAIIGGAKGAAIGAVIGGGAGAGSVVVTGKEDIRLMPGSMMTVQSSSPANISRDK